MCYEYKGGFLWPYQQYASVPKLWLRLKDLFGSKFETQLEQVDLPLKWLGSAGSPRSLPNKSINPIGFGIVFIVSEWLQWDFWIFFGCTLAQVMLKIACFHNGIYHGQITIPTLWDYGGIGIWLWFTMGIHPLASKGNWITIYVELGSLHTYSSTPIIVRLPSRFLLGWYMSK